MRHSALLLIPLLCGPAIAEAECALGARPAATLLIPYFEVDLTHPFGATTLFAVGNAESSPVIARVQLWTDHALPTLGFDIVLGPNDLQSLNLRDVFNGALPVTNVVLANCKAPIDNGTLSGADLDVLRREHSGLPVSPGGPCWGSSRANGKAIGFITVDAMNSCANGGARSPTLPGYFAANGTGFASNRNALYGDYFFVDPSQNAAQGDVAIHLPADSSRTGPTFYRWADGLRFEPRPEPDGRAPLPTRQRARFLNGGAFTGGTDILLWQEPTRTGPVACGSLIGEECEQTTLTVHDETGEMSGARGELLVWPMQISQKARLFTDPIFHSVSPPWSAPVFGFFDVSHRIVVACTIVAIGVDPLQAATVVLHSASGRFSVGMGAISTACVE